MRKKIDKNYINNILTSEIAYDILDSSNANGGTWCAGGCAILAFALNITYGFPVYVIYNKTLNQIEHFGVKTPDNTYIDCNGEQREWIRNFKRREFYMHPEYELIILPYDNNLNNKHIPIDMSASKKLVELFNPPKPIQNKPKTLHDGLF